MCVCVCVAVILFSHHPRRHCAYEFLPASQFKAAKGARGGALAQPGNPRENMANAIRQLTARVVPPRPAQLSVDRRRVQRERAAARAVAAPVNLTVYAPSEAAAPRGLFLAEQTLPARAAAAVAAAAAAASAASSASSSSSAATAAAATTAAHSAAAATTILVQMALRQRRMLHLSELHLPHLAFLRIRLAMIVRRCRDALVRCGASHVVIGIEPVTPDSTQLVFRVRPLVQNGNAHEFDVVAHSPLEAFSVDTNNMFVAIDAKNATATRAFHAQRKARQAEVIDELRALFALAIGKSDSCNAFVFALDAQGEWSRKPILSLGVQPCHFTWEALPPRSDPRAQPAGSSSPPPTVSLSSSSSSSSSSTSTAAAAAVAAAVSSVLRSSSSSSSSFPSSSSSSSSASSSSSSSSSSASRSAIVVTTFDGAPLVRLDCLATLAPLIAAIRDKSKFFEHVDGVEADALRERLAVLPLTRPAFPRGL